MKRSKVIQRLTSIFFIFALLLGMVLQSNTAFAQTERSETMIGNISVSDRQTGEVPANGFTQGQQLQINLSLDPTMYGANLVEGDFYTITLPRDFIFPTDDPSIHLNVYDLNGEVLARAVVASDGDVRGGGTVRVTFTDRVLNNPETRGTLKLFATLHPNALATTGTREFSMQIGRGNTAIGSINVAQTPPATQTPPALPTPNIEDTLSKQVDSNITPEGNVNWTLTINKGRANLNNVVVKDELSVQDGNVNGIQYVDNSFYLEEVELDDNGNVVRVLSKRNISADVQVSADKRNFTYNMNTIEGKQYVIKYTTTSRENSVLFSNTRFSHEGAEFTQNFSFTREGGNPNTPPVVDTPKTPEKIDINVKKESSDTDKTPVTAILKADGKEIARHTLTAPNWEHTFRNLDKFENGTNREIRYTVEAEPTQNVEKETHFVVNISNAQTNVIEEQQFNGSVRVTKVWEGVTGEFPTVKLQLFKNGQPEREPIELSKGETTYTWYDLETVDKEGRTNVYSVKEVGEENTFIRLDNNLYKVTYEGNFRQELIVRNKRSTIQTSNEFTSSSNSGGGGDSRVIKLSQNNNVVNEPKQPSNREIRVTKTWKDYAGNAIAAPTDKIIVELYKNGSATGRTLELNAGNNWSGTFQDVELRNGPGSTEQAQYSVKEIGETDNITKFEGKEYKISYSGSMGEGFVISGQTGEAPATPTASVKAPEAAKPAAPKAPRAGKTPPPTGDGANVLFYGMMLLASGSLLAVLARSKRHAK